MMRWFANRSLKRRIEAHDRWLNDPETEERLRNLPPAGFIRRDTGEFIGIRRRFLDRERVRIDDCASLWPGEEATVCGYFPWSTDGPPGTFRETPYMVYVWAANGYEQYAETELEKLQGTEPGGRL